MIRMFWFVAIFSSILAARPAHCGKNESLLRAVLSGDTARVEQLMQKGAEVDFKGWDKDHGVTPLAAAIERHDLSMVRFLLARGASPAASRDMALEAAARSPQGDIVTMLLARGARFSSEHATTMIERRNFESARALVADSSFCSGKSDYSLSFLVGMPNCEAAIWSAAQVSQFEIVKALLARGPDGAHALQMAAKAGRIGLIDTLLVLGANPNATCIVSRKMTPEEVKSQGVSGAKVSVTLKTNTVLASMCSGGHLDAARLLLNHGASPEGNPRFEETPLALAEARGDSAMIVLLKQHLVLRENRPSSSDR